MCRRRRGAWLRDIERRNRLRWWRGCRRRRAFICVLRRRGRAGVSRWRADDGILRERRLGGCLANHERHGVGRGRQWRRFATHALWHALHLGIHRIQRRGWTEADDGHWRRAALEPHPLAFPPPPPYPPPAP